MPVFETPYGTVDAPDLGAAQKWIARQKPAGEPQDTGTAPAATQQPPEQKDAPGGLERLWRGIVGTPDQAGNHSGVLGGLWDRLVADKPLLGIGPEKNPLQTSAEIAAEHPYRPGIKMGEMMPKDPLANPMVMAMGTGNIGGRMPMRSPSPEATQRLQDFAAQGVRPNVPVIGQGRAAGLAAQAGRVLPFSPVRKGFEGTLADTSAAAERAASGYGAATDEFGAGSVARNSVRKFAEDRSQATQDYGEFFRVMHGAPPTPMNRTLQTLRDFRGRFPNAPGLTGIFTNPKLSKLAQELEPQTKTIPAQTSPMLNQFGQPAVTRPAQTVTTGGSLSMPELRELRTQVGYMLENPSFGPEDIPRAQLKQLYGALTQDMQSGARARGPAAVKALNRATINYGTRMRMLDRLEPLISPDAPEKVFSRIEQAAKSSGSADAGLLQAAQKSMSKDEWGNVGAAVIRRMGNPSPGQAQIAGAPSFSTNTYATNWNKLSGRAKDLLFGADSPGSPRAGLEQLARVVNAQKAVGSLANTSRTWENAAVAGMVGEMLNALMSGRVPIRELAGYSGAMGGAKLLMSPAFTRWLYQLPPIARQSQDMAGFQGAALNSLKAALRGGIGQETGKEMSDRKPGVPGTPPPRPPGQHDVSPPPSIR